MEGTITMRGGGEDGGELKLITLRHQVVIKPASVTPAVKQHRPLIESLGSRGAQVHCVRTIATFIFYDFCIGVGVAQSVCRLGYRLGDRASIPDRDRKGILSLRPCFQTSSEAHPFSYPMGTGAHYLG